MKYRYFANDFISVLRQFQENYGKENVFYAITEREFDILINSFYDKHPAIIFNTQIFINKDYNLEYIPGFEKYFDYIVFVGKNLEEINGKIKKLKAKRKRKELFRKIFR